jgi:WD40 repeat protein
MNTRIGAIVLLVLLVLVTGCGGGGTTNPTSPSSPTPVPAPVAISLNQTAVTLDVGNQFTFVATVTGMGNKGVSWAIQEGTSGGNITSSGVYTAPATDGVFHVIATSQADTTQKATATVTVATLVVSVSPPSNVLGPLGVRAFSATVNTSLNTSVTWSVLEAAGGAITTGGQYTAPNTTGGPFHVVATSVQDSSKTGIASVTIVPSGFRPTGDMSTGRAEHTATLLPNGKVLIAGGDSCSFINYYQSCPLDSAEVYDPVAGTFATTGKMSVTRFFHTATLLGNGKVLITGGHDASAELYDPTPGTFAATTGSMSVGRSSHTATLLASGKVLIAGGSNSTGALATAELYDPNAGTFTATGSMAAGRTSHTATLLANGKVLIAGGSNSTGAPLATTELYDPAKGNFTAANSMLSPRIFHTATQLSNGNVLVTGGIANLATGASLPSAEVYDVVAGTFTATTGPMVTARDSHFAVLLANGTVLVAGGSFGSNGSFTAELYNTASGTFTETGGMETGRALAAAVLLLDGRVFVSGGSDTISAELYK